MFVRVVVGFRDLESGLDGNGCHHFSSGDEEVDSAQECSCRSQRSWGFEGVDFWLVDFELCPLLDCGLDEEIYPAGLVAMIRQRRT